MPSLKISPQGTLFAVTDSFSFLEQDTWKLKIMNRAGSSARRFQGDILYCVTAFESQKSGTSMPIRSKWNTSNAGIKIQSYNGGAYVDHFDFRGGELLCANLPAADPANGS